MVKKLDDNALLDHIGWRLWQASRAWQGEFAAGMREAGHEWFSEARAGLIGHIPRHGLRQSRLIERMGISKQAVQQLIDGLEAEGILRRRNDPEDRRGKVIVFTEKGLAALSDGEHIKLAIERGYRERLGDIHFSALMEALRALDGLS
ncbi:MarR family transcriptional regulator [Rhizobium tropici]|uniref:MarR family transcriptional regulator n=1 Tax=Rhizobium tropici TaxID=398 RepID=A0A5B0WDD9_RHITR|nr:MarR family transcriptional regulator [Rhizobium tropici]